MTLTAVATAYPSDPQPRVRIDLTTTGGASALFTLVRNDPDGRSRPVLTELNPHFTSGAWTLYDYHAPFNQAVTYTVSSESLSGTSGAATLTMSQSWLIHRTNPSLSTPIDKVKTIGDRVTPSTATLHWAYGATYPVSRGEGVRRARSGNLVFQALSQAGLQDVHDLLADSSVCLMNLVLPGWPDESWAWIQPGDVTDTNIAQSVYYPRRDYSFPYQVVDTPAGTLAPTWTLDGVASAFGTLNDVAAAYSSLANLAIDFRTA